MGLVDVKRIPSELVAREGDVTVAMRRRRERRRWRAMRERERESRNWEENGVKVGALEEEEEEGGV